MTLKQKYEDVLKQMRDDVNGRLVEATQNLNEKTEEQVQCREKIGELKVTAATSRKEFLNVGRQIIKMYFQNTSTPKEVEQVIEPCNTYIEAAGALPMVEECMRNIQLQMDVAQDAVNKETALLSSVQNLLNCLSKE